MKNMKRSIALVVAIALLIGCAAGGTMAWLTMKTAPVVNTFTTSDVSITLTENTGAEYKMVPGKTITKDPKVTVEAGSEACWLFVEVIENTNGGSYDFSDYLEYKVGPEWKEVTDGVYYLKVDAPGAFNIIYYDADKDGAYDVGEENKVHVPDDVTKAMMTAVGDKYPTLSFTAYAIQQAGFDTLATDDANAAAAWAQAETLNP